MSWLGIDADPRTISTAGIGEQYAAFLTSVETAVGSPRLLALVEYRLGYIHGHPVASNSLISKSEATSLAQGEFSDFPRAEASVLAIAERIAFDHHSITDQQVAELSKAWGEATGIALLTAIAFIDVKIRMAQTLATSVQPASTESN